MNKKDDWLTVSEAGKETGMSERTIRRRINDGELTAYHRGGKKQIMYLKRSELEAYLQPVEKEL